MLAIAAALCVALLGGHADAAPRRAKSRAKLATTPTHAPADLELVPHGAGSRWRDAFRSRRGGEPPRESFTSPPMHDDSSRARHGFPSEPASDASPPLRLAADRPAAVLAAPPAAAVSFGAVGLAPLPAGPDDPEPEPEPTAEAPSDDDEDRRVPSTLLNRRGVPPFWIDRDYDTHRTRAVAFPPLFVHRTPKPDHPEKLLHIDLAFTFGWYAEGAERRRWFNPIGLFFGGFSERKTVWGAIPILTGYRRVGEQYNFGSFPLVWAWGTKFVKNFLFAPFHYQQRAPDGYRGVSATILFWYGHRNLQDADLSNDKSHFVAAPVFWRFRRGLRQFDISPIYVGGYNKLKGLRHASVFPFVLWQSREFGNRRELWTLPFIRRTDQARRRRAWAVPFLLTFSHDDPDRAVFSASPLVWRTENRLAGRKTLVALPFVRTIDPRQRTTIVAPIWWDLHDRRRQRSTMIAFPFAVARRDPSRLYVVSLLGGGGRSDRGYAVAVPPALTFLGRTDQGTRYHGVAGIAWHVFRPGEEGQRGRDTVVIGPAAYARVDDKGVRFGLPPALLFFSVTGPKRYQVFAPLLWHVRENTPERDRRTFVFTPFYHHRLRTAEGSQTDGGLAPILFYGAGSRHRYGVVPFALFAHVTDVAADRHLTLFPLFVRSKAPDHRTLGVAGLVWDVKRTDERHSVAFPFFYRRQIADRTLTLTPLGGRYRNGSAITTVIGPWVRRRTEDRDGRGVLPIVWVDDRRTDEGRVRNIVGAPLFLQRRGPAYDVEMWSPLVWRSNIRVGKPRKGLAVVPFYFRQRQPEGVDVDAGLGWFWSRDDRRRTHTLIAGPAFHRLSRKSINTGIAPLYWWTDSETSRRLIALPTIVHVEDKSKNSHTTIAVPLWFDRLRANGRRTWGVFPMVFGGKGLHNFTRFSVAPPGYVDVFRLHRNTRFVGYVPLLFRFDKCGFRAEDEASCRYRLWGSFPLFLYGRDGQGRRTYGSLAVYVDRRDKGVRVWTPIFGLTNWRDDMLAWYAGPIGVRTTRTHQRVFAFPLYYRRKHRLEDTSFTMVAPPLYIGRHRKDRRFFEAGLLFWQFRQQHKVSTAIVPPVFFHSHSFAQRRLTWLMPLFLRDDHWGKDEAWTALGPVLWVQRRHGKNLDFVQFPLIWHIERGENQGTFGAFLWWDIRVKGKTFQLAPGAFFRWATPRKATSVIGPGLGWWTRDADPTGDLHWRALFGLFGGGREAGRRYVSIVGGKIWGGPAKAPKQKAKRERKLRTRTAQRSERARQKSAAKIKQP